MSLTTLLTFPTAGWAVRVRRFRGHVPGARGAATVQGVRVEHHDGRALRRRGTVERRELPSGVGNQTVQGRTLSELGPAMAFRVTFSMMSRDRSPSIPLID